MKIPRLFRTWFSAVAGTVEAFSNYGAILVNLNPSGRYTKTNKGIAGGFALANGIIETVTCYNFQGREIERHLNGDQEIDDDEFLILAEQFSKKHKAAYLGSRYGYMVTSLLSDLAADCLLYSAAKAYLGDLIYGDDEFLSSITRWELGGILLYFLLFDLLFILTGEMAQTLKEMRSHFHIPAKLAPDRGFVKFIRNNQLTQLIAKSNTCRKLIRISGSAGDTFEHILPLILSIPPSWVLGVASLTSFWGISIGLAACSILSVIILECYLATYWFEGKFVEQNLRAIAHDNSKNGDEKPYLQPWLATLFFYLLYIGGGLHGIDDWLSVELGGKELGIPGFILHPVALLVFATIAIAYHFSEVVTAQKQIPEITKPIAANATTVMRNTRSPLSDGARDEIELDEARPLKLPFESIPTINHLPLPRP